MNCAVCAAPSPGGGNFCTECGSRLDAWEQRPPGGSTGGAPAVAPEDELAGPTVITDAFAAAETATRSDAARTATADTTRRPPTPAPSPRVDPPTPGALPWGSPASFGHRAGARLLDWIVTSVVWIVGLAVVYVVARPGGGLSIVGLVIFFLVWLLLPALVSLVYRVVGEGNAAGQTLGKAMCGIRVVRIDAPNRPAGKGKALGRYLVTGLGNMVLFLGDLSMLWSPDRRTWGDKATGTAVVHTARPGARVAGGSAGAAAAITVAVGLTLGLVSHVGAVVTTGGYDPGSFSADGAAGGDAATGDVATGKGAGSTGNSVPSRVDPANSSRLATTISAPPQAPNGKDDAGTPTTYHPSNIYDEDASTCWRMPGDGSGKSVVFALVGSHTVTSLGLINGYAKTDPASGVRRYFQERRITSATWVFDDGTRVDQQLDASTEQMQRVTLDRPVVTATVTLHINATTVPGDARYDYTAISEADIQGQ